MKLEHFLRFLQTLNQGLSLIVTGIKRQIDEVKTELTGEVQPEEEKTEG